MVLTYVKKIRHSVLCATGVYLRDITNTTLSILELECESSAVCFWCCWSKSMSRQLFLRSIVMAEEPHAASLPGNTIHPAQLTCRSLCWLSAG